MKDNIKTTLYGYEITWADKETYCAKILIFEKAYAKFPLHFYKNKNRSWFVNAGKFNIRWIDTNEGKVYEQELLEGSVFDIPPLMPVLLESLTDNSSIAESSDGKENDIYKLG